jgi:phosphoribosylcarboxyaminoimidazole (NCAIR) mutase
MAARPKTSSRKKPVAIIMGSQSDWATMQHAAETLERLKVGYDALIVSAHRTPDRLYASQSRHTRSTRLSSPVPAARRICPAWRRR